MRRTKEEAEQTKRNVMDAARSLFSKYGYAATTLANIAEEAGVTHGAIYHHFDSKANLHAALIEEASLVTSEAVEAAVQQGGSLQEIIQHIIVHVMRLLEEDRRFREGAALSLFQPTTTLPRMTGHTEQKPGEIVRLVERIAMHFKQGIEAGELPSDLDPTAIASSLVAYLSGLSLIWLTSSEGFPIKASAPEYTDIFLYGISEGN